MTYVVFILCDWNDWNDSKDTRYYFRMDHFCIFANTGDFFKIQMINNIPPQASSACYLKYKNAIIIGFNFDPNFTQVTLFSAASCLQIQESWEQLERTCKLRLTLFQC